MANNKPIKVSEEGYNFLYDLQTNIRTIFKQKNFVRPNIDFPTSLELVAKYFKSNNDRYLELIKLYEDKK